MNHLKLTQPILTCHKMYRSKTCTELKVAAFQTNHYKIKTFQVQINGCERHPCFIPTCFSSAGLLSRNFGVPFTPIYVYLYRFYLFIIAVKVQSDNEPVYV